MPSVIAEPQRRGDGARVARPRRRRQGGGMADRCGSGAEWWCGSRQRRQSCGARSWGGTERQRRSRGGGAMMAKTRMQIRREAEVGRLSRGRDSGTTQRRDSGAGRGRGKAGAVESRRRSRGGGARAAERRKRHGGGSAAAAELGAADPGSSWPGERRTRGAADPGIVELWWRSRMIEAGMGMAAMAAAGR